MAVLGGGVVAAWTLAGALDTLVTLIEVRATPEVAAFPWLDLPLLVVFMVAFGVGTHAADRLVVGGLRWLLSG